MIVKILRNASGVVPVGGPLTTNFYECDRVLVDGYSGATGQESTRVMYLESGNQEAVSVDFRKEDHVYLLNNLGKTIDFIKF